MFDLNLIPPQPQRQDSFNNQLADLIRVANRLGMYDAADGITQIYNKSLKTPNLIKYGCYVDGPDNIDSVCVLDSIPHERCIYAEDSMRKEQCKYWKIIT
jgi:hypothetical protein